jgi:hypothetical protein
MRGSRRNEEEDMKEEEKGRSELAQNTSHPSSLASIEGLMRS